MKTNTALPCYVEVTDEPIIPAKVGMNNAVTPAKQNVYLHAGQRYPLPFKINVPEAGPYRPGNYLLGGPIFRIGEYGLDIGSRKDLVLVDASEALKALTAPAPLRAAS